MLLKIQDLGVSFKQGKTLVKAIDGLTLEIAKGETLALLGESGCGKSLTARAIMQLLAPNAFLHEGSSIRFLNHDISLYPESSLRRIRGKEIAIIFQEPMTSLNPVLTIGRQLAEALPKDKTLHKSSLKKVLIDLLKEVDIPDPERRLNEYPHQLSGGQKQRVMIAMAIAQKPSLLIADEPTTALDVTVESQILALLKHLQHKLGMGMLLITHDLSVVRRVADKVAVMYAGELVETGSANAFFTHPLHPYSQRLLASVPHLAKRKYRLNNIEGVVPQLNEIDGACRFKARCLEAFSACSEHPPLFDRGEDHLVRCHYYDSALSKTLPPLVLEKNEIQAHEFGRPLLTVKEAKVYYPIRQGILKREVDSVKAVDGVSFVLHEGETLALVGESGCGKSTLARALVQLEPLHEGEVYFKEKPLQKKDKHFQKGIQIIFQDPYSSMNPRMLVEDILLEGTPRQGRAYSEKEREKRVNDLLDLVGLPKNIAHRYPHQFSGGQRQRISIARALAVNPRMIICDEPTSALDVSVQAQILNLLRELQRELSLSYLFITHDMAVVSYLADRIMVMREGKIIEEGVAERVIDTPQNPYTNALLKAVSESDD